jgi:hypothetical protein
MLPSLLLTLLELGHDTSQNLGFAYADQHTSYGEETITETNLLAFRRRHPIQVHVVSFSKKKESHITGADWEWHIIGNALTLKLRVQAKRITKTGKIGKLDGQASKAPSPQIDLLISDALTHQMRPMYCFYCAEKHRKYWASKATLNGLGTFETGCLIVDASDIRKMNPLPNALNKIEHHTVPWHYLVSDGLFVSETGPYEIRFQEPPTYRLVQKVRRLSGETKEEEPSKPQHFNFPTTADLNAPEGRDFNKAGTHPTDRDSFERLPDLGELRERGISRLVMIDARDPDFMAMRFRDLQ